MVNDLIAGVAAGIRPAKRGVYLAEVVEKLQALPRAEAADMLARMPDVRAVAALDRPEFDTAPEVLALLPLARARRLVGEMSEDRAADVLAEMGEAGEPILAALEPDVRRSLNAHLGFLVRWAVLLDYLFLPMAIWLIGAAYLVFIGVRLLLAGRQLDRVTHAGSTRIPAAPRGSVVPLPNRSPAATRSSHGPDDVRSGSTSSSSTW